MKTITASQARAQLFNLLKITVKGHRQIRITSKEGSAVVMSEEDYESLIETLELLSIKGFRESIDTADAEIERGDLFTIEEAFE
jgi:antitoxin YefM